MTKIFVAKMLLAVVILASIFPTSTLKAELGEPEILPPVDGIYDGIYDGIMPDELPPEIESPIVYGEFLERKLFESGQGSTKKPLEQYNFSDVKFINIEYKYAYSDEKIQAVRDKVLNDLRTRSWYDSQIETAMEYGYDELVTFDDEMLKFSTLPLYNFLPNPIYDVVIYYMCDSWLHKGDETNTDLCNIGYTVVKFTDDDNRERNVHSRGVIANDDNFLYQKGENYQVETNDITRIGWYNEFTESPINANDIYVIKFVTQEEAEKVKENPGNYNEFIGNPKPSKVWEDNLTSKVETENFTFSLSSKGKLSVTEKKPFTDDWEEKMNYILCLWGYDFMNGEVLVGRWACNTAEITIKGEKTVEEPKDPTPPEEPKDPTPPEEPKDPTPPVSTPISSGGGGSSGGGHISSIPPSLVNTISKIIIEEIPLFSAPVVDNQCVSALYNLDDPRLISYYEILGIINPNYVDRPISRGEFVKLITNASKVDIKTIDLNILDAFSDVKKTDWFAPYVAHALHKNYLHGQNKNGKKIFRPQDYVTRAEAAKVLTRLVEMDEEKLPKISEIISFVDVNPEEILSPYIQSAFNMCLLHGRNTRDGATLNNEGRLFEPATNISVAEIAKILYNMTHKK